MKVTRTYMRLAETKKRVVLSRGGSSSSKTYSTVQMLVKWLYTGEFRRDEWIYEGVATVVRKHSVELSRSVLRDFKNICREEGFLFSNRSWGGKTFKENKSERTYEYEGRTLEFVGLDDPEKAKGPRRKILYSNEANNIDYKVFMQLLMRTEVVAICDWNPDDEDIWLKTEIEDKRFFEKGDVDLIVSTFRDNRYLTDSIVEELLGLRKSDPELWNVYGNGHYGRITGAIFTKGEHWDVIEDLPTDKDGNLECKKKGYGQDFGFSNDPTTLIGIYEYGKDTIILDEIFWKTNLINTYQDDSNKQASITGQYEMHGVEKHEKIVADSSEPKSIEEIYHAGYNIHPVKKGPGSVVSGIKMMKKFKILITARSVNLIKEFSKYVWATDKYGKPLRDREGRPIPLDKFNHGIDASSYGVRTFFEGQQEFFTGFF